MEKTWYTYVKSIIDFHYHSYYTKIACVRVPLQKAGDQDNILFKAYSTTTSSNIMRCDSIINIMAYIMKNNIPKGKNGVQRKGNVLRFGLDGTADVCIVHILDCSQFPSAALLLMSTLV